MRRGVRLQRGCDPERGSRSQPACFGLLPPGSRIRRAAFGPILRSCLFVAYSCRMLDCGLIGLSASLTAAAQGAQKNAWMRDGIQALSVGKISIDVATR